MNLKPVVGYEDSFAISECGQLKNVKTNRILKQTINKSGYYTVTVKIGGRKGKAVCFKIHRVVASAFLDEPSEAQLAWAKTTKYGVVEVNHIDGNKLNNHYTNLEWATGSQNMKHAHKTGLQNNAKGCNHSCAKLTQDQVDDIRARYVPYCQFNGGRALSREYDISHAEISRIVNYKRYLS